MGKILNALKGAVVRLFFGVHIVVCVYQLVEEKQQWGWWFIAVGACVLLFAEAAATYGCSNYVEWRRFIPCIFIYLLGTVPALGITEWSLLNTRLEYKNATGDCPNYVMKQTSDISGVQELTYEFSITLHQSIAILIVSGRWVLLKGDTSTRNLLNKLLASVGMATDILVFYSEGIHTNSIRCVREITLAVLVIWSVSLFQLSFDTTPSTKDPKINKSILQRCRSTEIWAIILNIFLQDGPFLAMRLYLIIAHDVFEQGLMFFAYKNIFVVLLQLYRLWALLCLTWDVENAKFTPTFMVSAHNQMINHVRMEAHNEVFGNDDVTHNGNNDRPAPFSVSTRSEQHHDNNTPFQIQMSTQSPSDATRHDTESQRT